MILRSIFYDVSINSGRGYNKIMKIPNKILDYIYLTRLDRPIGIYLLFFPCLFGTALAAGDTEVFIYYGILFFIGSILMRSAGCIINDLSDKDLDIHVERTKKRPIASGKVSTREAIICLTILLTLSLLVLIQLNVPAITISLSSIILVVLYPFMKRITYWPQAFLGITYNVGVLVSYAAINPPINFNAIVLYIGCIFWTLGYDTIYAFMDTKDDLKIGIKSSAIAIKDSYYKFILLLFYIIFILCVIISTYNANALSAGYVVMLLVAILQLAWQIETLDITEPQNCLKRFKSNQYIGIIITLTILFSKVPPLKIV
ncbi:MAG: ubiA [Rickettsiaceae bacterium]|jgi:4-hydroxybenzoate polyprenyltransferase|nr:ubiA [Rickettsiaceae bacterium]